MRKEDAKAAVDAMEAEFDLDTLVERLIFINQINVGRADVAAGRTHAVDELQTEIAKWKAAAREAKPDFNAA